MRVAIIGAGMAGLTLGQELQDAGFDVLLFDKGRGVGGRMATRDREQGEFDHGAQRFTARSEVFQKTVAQWERDGLVAQTEPDSDETWWIPVRSTNHLVRAMALDLEVRTEVQVSGIRRKNGMWTVQSNGPDEGEFDRVLITAPAPQAARILGSLRIFESTLEAAEYEPTWSMFVVCNTHETLPKRIFTKGPATSPINLLIREGLKPGRTPDGPLARLTIHASTEFSKTHLEDEPARIVELLTAALHDLLGPENLRIHLAHAHRWRYARVSKAVGQPSAYAPDKGLGLAGDYFLGPRIEAAYLSALDLAQTIIGLEKVG